MAVRRPRVVAPVTPRVPPTVELPVTAAVPIFAVVIVEEVIVVVAKVDVPVITTVPESVKVTKAVPLSFIIKSPVESKLKTKSLLPNATTVKASSERASLKSEKSNESAVTPVVVALNATPFQYKVFPKLYNDKAVLEGVDEAIVNPPPK